ncbi:MAG: PPC domain-containing protein [Burkholderiales bacterium]|nr:PPC domain-containing protein [Anaerolineae bacterium]
MSTARVPILLLILLAALFAVGSVQAQIEPVTPSPDVETTPTATPAPVFPLAPGTSIEGNINNSLPSARFSFTARSGDNVVIAMESTSGDLDPLLLLFGPDGELVAQNDDADTGNRDARIDTKLERDGIFTIEATRFQSDAGSSIGTYRLRLDIAGAIAGGSDDTFNPLEELPDFGVDFTVLVYQDFGAGRLAEANPLRYFAIGGQQGDLVRAVMTTTEGSLVPQLSLRNANLTVISQESQTRTNESVAYATLPETGWYLIEAAGREGSGSFDLYVDALAGAVLEVGEQITGQFTPDTPSISYVFNAHIGDLVAANMFTSGSAEAVPELQLLDLNLQSIASDTGERFATLQVPIPRSGAYILQVNNLRPGTSGNFNLRLTGIPVDIEKLTVNLASYNESFTGEIDAESPILYYRFAGKAGELVTLQMTADASSTLDPYLILADAELNELAFNDNASSSRNARITQFALPADGNYYVLATRAGLANGTSSGSFNLGLSAGAIALEGGAVTATLTWNSDADLNLFVRDPSGRTVSWSNPQAETIGGTLQIDSNTNCITPSAQPVEHIYWPGLTPVGGDYEVRVWFQNVCGSTNATPFNLVLSVGGQTILETGDTLQPGQRFDASIRVLENGTGSIVNRGRVVNPTPQQESSEGGDILIVYGDSVTGTLNNDVYALFYQFNGAAGDAVDISAETLTGDLDSILVLRDADDNNLASNDDASPDTRSPRLVYSLPYTGQYVIAVTRFGLREGTTSGDFRLSLSSSP